ncbi:hypothetical protein [uncultured Cedecea sp.]|uniref:hypothetical protein n=1 Tax=uncultured Cedecea sp. TaxID=988762 RepID=UPI00260A1D1D|nr:hypothetical protein [uncultured Cedecea sp.]
MSEVTEEKKELALVTLPVEKQDLEVALLNDQFIDELLENVRKTASSVVGDLKTAKGRGVYITMADKVRKSKAAFEVRAKELVAELKARPALIDASRKKFRDEMDKIAVEIRKPVTEWEAEQNRLKAEEEAKKAAEELAKEIEMAHREALIDNYEFDRALEEAKAEAERQRIAHEEELKRQAEEKVKRELEEKQQREREASAARERESQLRVERAEQARKDAIAKAESDKKAAQEKAEREKQQAIEDERRKAAAAEQARLAEEKRIADEKAKREADQNHRKAIGTEIVNALLANANIDRVQAIQVLTALKDGNIPHTAINY